MTPGRAALVGLMHRYLGGLMDPFVTLLEVHKLMYFMQEAGSRCGCNTTKALMGHMPRIFGTSCMRSRDTCIWLCGRWRCPDKQIELVPGAVNDAETFLKDKQETVVRFDRVGKLVEGFETPFGLELLATVHWVATQEQAVNVEDTVAKVYAWGDRKKRFSPRQIGIALEALRTKGWLAAG